LKNSVRLTLIFFAFVCIRPSDCLAQRPELVLQTGPVGEITTVTFTRDGKSLIGAGENIKIWDIATGTELRSFDTRGHVYLSPDGTTFVGTSGIIDSPFTGALTRWDVKTGKVLDSFEAVGATALSADLKTFARAHFEKGVLKLEISDVASRRQVFSLPTSIETVWTMAFTPDGSILGISDGYRIEFWEVHSGKLLRAIKGTRNVGRFVFSPDGKMMATGFSTTRDEMVVKLWDVATGEELRTMRWPRAVPDEYLRSLAFSPDGKTLASASHEVKLWDVATGAELRTLKWPPETLPKIVSAKAASSVAFSPDGQTIAAGSGFSITLWNVATGNPLRSLQGLSTSREQPDSFSDQWWSPKCGSTFRFAESLTGAESQLYNLRAFNVGEISEGAAFSESAVFSRDGTRVALTCDVDEVKVYDVQTGKLVRAIVVDPSLHEDEDNDVKDQIHLAALSPDGRILVTANDATFRMWNVATGARIRTFKSDSGGGGDKILFSTDKKLVALGRSYSVVLRNLTTGAIVRTFAGSLISFTPDGKTLITGGEHVKFWNLASGAVTRSFNFGDATLSPDGRTLGVEAKDGVRLLSVATGRDLQFLKGAGKFVFSLDNKYVLSNNTIWSAITGQELARIERLNWFDWVAVTPDGLFDGTPEAWKQIIWRFNNNTFDHAPVEAFFNEFYYPGLLPDVFAGKYPKAPSDISQKDRRQPQLKLTLASNDGNSPVREGARIVAAKVDITESDADKDHKTGTGAQDVRLFRNGSLVKVWRGDVLKGQSSVTLEATVPIVAGKNRFTAYAFNHDNIKSSDAELTVTGADNLKRQGTAYVLAIGVNDYANQNYSLKYAVADADDFAAEVKRQQESLKRYAKVEVISLSDAQATKVNITRQLAELARQVGPEDAVIVFFAGHGTAHGNQFYLIPHDLGYDGPREKLTEAGLQSILAHSISDRDLEKSFETIDAGQLLLVIDACNSGQALEAEEKRRGPMNSKGLAQLAYEKGMYVLTAAQSYQAAQEAAKFGHGFLTYALVEEGLKQGAADREPKNGSIDIREWLNFATDEVPKMQEQNSAEALRGRGRYVVFVGDGRDVGIPKTEGEARDNVQRPRVFYRREIENNPLIVGVSTATAH